MIYDLRTEAWIPVLWEGESNLEMVGLEEALAKAHAWTAVSDALPTVEFGLYRLLIALTLDIFKPAQGHWTRGYWKKLWDKKQFDAQCISDYFAQHDTAFDLFSETMPFGQTAGMDTEKAKPLAGMFHPLPSGTNAGHFHHAHEEDFAVSPAVAARLLTTIAPWMTAGGAGLSPSINGAPPWYVLPTGSSGFETLLLNCPIIPDLVRHAKGEEIPAWRSREAITSRRAESASILASLTWQPRRVQLVPDTQGGVCSLTGELTSIVVRSMKFAPGLGAGFEWTDPHTAYRIGEQRTIVRPREGREAWRDSGPLALLREKSTTTRKAERPAIISQLAAFVQGGELSGDYELHLDLYGIRSDLKMKMFEWQRERLNIPFQLMWDEVGVNDPEEALDIADKVAFQVRRAIKLAYFQEGKGNDKGFEALCKTASMQFWRELRSHYDAFLAHLVEVDGTQQRLDLLQSWRHRVRDTGWKALRDAIENIDATALELERQTNAYKAFDNALFPIIEPLKADEFKKKKAKTKA
jgi:CRISPR system Cascade subunit CasA